ncbi:hypothetical protein BC332_03390 [Capsicum chinense]|nr:hypothetical protein BC332_03390 [Capsicum chinense]
MKFLASTDVGLEIRGCFGDFKLEIRFELGGSGSRFEVAEHCLLLSNVGLYELSYHSWLSDFTIVSGVVRCFSEECLYAGVAALLLLVVEVVSLVIRDQIFMARLLLKFAPHIGCHTVNDIEDRIKTMLTKSEYKMFCTKSIFGFFMKKKYCVVQAQLGRCIMSLETRESSTSAIVIQAKGTILHYTIREFSLVTGLNCATNKDEFVFDEKRPNRIIDQYFDGCHTVNDIEDRIKTMLTKSEYKMFCTKSIFGFFMKKKYCVVQAQLGRCIMSLETRESSTSAIVIQAKGTILHYTIREFSLVTGLNCATNKDEFVFDEKRPNRIIDQYFDGECSKIASPVALDSESEQEKVEEVIRDQIFMARLLLKFAPHIGCHTVNDIEDRIKTMLTKSEYKMFCTKSIFGFFMKKKYCVVQAQLGRCIMSLETRESSTSAIVIQAKGTILHYTIREFSLVTGLNCATNKDEFVFDEKRPNRIIDQYFDELARSLHKKLKPKGKFYMLLGMPLAIQIWLYECCSNVPRNVASKVDSQIPRILNWKTNSPRPRYETLMGSMFDDTDDKPHPKGVDELTSKRTPSPRAAKMPFVRTPIHKSIQTKFTLRGNRKDINRPDSKISIPVQSPALSSFSSKDEDGVVSKKVCDKFCEKKQAKGSEFDQPPADENVKSTSPHQVTTKFVHEFNKNPENKEGAIEMNVNTPAGHESEVNDVDNSKLDQQYKSAVHIPAGVNVESNADQHLSDSQNTLPNELLPSLNVYVNLERSIIVHPSTNQAQQTPMHVSRIRRPSRYNESPFTMKFGSADGKVIPICLIECKFYENKAIDIDNHPNYKLNDKMDPFGVLIVENVPQQLSGSLDCGLYMVTYAEYLTFGKAVPCIDFDPDLIRIRFASLLWDYGTRKANAKEQSDDEAPMRPLWITELTEDTEVVDI